MKELVCIVCPRSCKMKIEFQHGEIVVSGNGCKRGKSFAINETTQPKRTLCSTVKTKYKEVPVLPVRVSGEIPKNKIFDVMKQISTVVVTEPISCGDIIVEDVLSLGVNVIATSSILKEIIKENG